MSFLDVEIIRKRGKFTTSVYRKPTFSGVYTHFDSFLPSTYKFGMIYTLAYRCFRICSDWTHFHAELVLLKEIFRKNAYPENFIDKCFKRFLDNIRAIKTSITTVEEKTFTTTCYLFYLFLCYLSTFSCATFFSTIFCSTFFYLFLCYLFLVHCHYKLRASYKNR